MKRLLLVLLLIVLPTAVIADSWTVIVWCNNQNNLYSYGHDDLNEMETCDYSQYGDGVDVIWLLGTTGGYGSQEAQLYHVDYDPQYYDGDEGMSHVVSTEINGHGIWDGTLDMDTDIDAFEDLVQWCVDNYPADHYAISAWDHGSGIWRDDTLDWIDRGACGDLKIWEFESALKNVGTYIDILGYDVCLLGQIETGYQMEDDVVGIQIASPDSEPGEGWDYQAFEIFQEDNDVTPEELATRIVDDYLDFYGSGVTQGAADVKNWDSVMSADWANLCQLLYNYCYQYEADISAARNSASYWNTSEDRDLYDFISALAADGDLPADLRSAADDVKSGLESYVLAGGMHNPIDGSGGLTIWFPTNGSGDSSWTSYQNNIDFSETLWDEFLEMYADPFPVEPVMLAVNGVSFDDSAGNGDGKIDPGETIVATVTLINNGTDTATGVSAELAIDDTYFTVTDGSADFGTIASGGTAAGDYTFEVAEDCPPPYNTSADLTASADGGYSEDLGFGIVVGAGFVDDMESGDGLWTHQGANDQWHLSDEDAVSGTYSWKCGDTGSGDYADDQESTLTTVPIFIDADHYELTFQTKYYVESGYDYVYLEIDDGGGWETLDTYNGNELSWQELEYNLSDYEGSVVQLRFRFYSDYTVNYEGFYCDDFFIDSVQQGFDDVVFQADAEDEGVLLSWSVGDPAELSGVNILRSDGGDYVRLNDNAIGDRRFLDRAVETDTGYSYKLELIDSAGRSELHGPISVSFSAADRVTSLGQNYPNPTAGATTIPFELAENGVVTVRVYDLAGRLVTTLVDEELAAGRHEVTWNTATHSSGIYLIRLEADGCTATRRLAVTR
jgi:hypothetical protein